MREMDALIIDDLNSLMTVHEAARVSGVSRRTIYQWVTDGKIWHCIIADKIMLHKDDVERIKAA
jgi:excisionase family DNA binding protein